jgi:hypothetical protein
MNCLGLVRRVLDGIGYLLQVSLWFASNALSIHQILIRRVSRGCYAGGHAPSGRSAYAGSDQQKVTVPPFPLGSPGFL